MLIFHSFLYVYQRVTIPLNDSVSQWAPRLTSVALQLQQHHILQGVDKGASTLDGCEILHQLVDGLSH